MISGRAVTAFEHDSIAVGEAATISEADASHLALLGQSRPGFCERAYRSVKLSQFCGLVPLSSGNLEILPKTHRYGDSGAGRDLLLRLLRLSDYSALFETQPAGHRIRPSTLLEIFIEHFFSIVMRLAKEGLLREYQELEQDLSVLRGKLVVHRQLGTLSNRLDRLACRYDELTADNRWNRAIKHALHLLPPHIYSAGLSRTWLELNAVMEDVVHVPSAQLGLRDLKFDRHAIRYRTAIQWVRWVVGLLSPALSVGDDSAPGLLFDMNKLFEHSVAKWLTRQLPGAEVSLQERETCLATLQDHPGKEVIPIQPDIVVRHRGRVIALADTKWKLLNEEGGRPALPQADVYQMHAYSAAYDCDTLLLIYPWHPKLEWGTETVLELPLGRSGRPRLTIACIDVESEPFVLRLGSPLLDRLRQRIAGISAA